MKKLNILALCGVLVLTISGCVQKVEKAPVSVQDEKVETQVTEAIEETDEKGSTVEGLENVTSLADAPEEVTIPVTTSAGEKTDTKWQLVKCDGGFGFYYPQGEDSIWSWKETGGIGDYEGYSEEDKEELQMISSDQHSYVNNDNMEIQFNVFRNESMEWAKQLIENMSSQGTEETSEEDSTSQKSEECTIGIGGYNAIRSPQITSDISEEGDLSVSQYYYVELPVGFLEISFMATSDDSKSWTTVEQILSTLIVENKDNYSNEQPAVAINAEGKELQFKNLSILNNFYVRCVQADDYTSAMAVSKNITPQENGKKAWEAMEGYNLAEPWNEAVENIAMIRDDRAVVPYMIQILNEAEIGLPKDQTIIRYAYFVKEGDYWYFDGPLHNAEPTQEWWDGKITSWEDYNYGFSDNKDLGTTQSKDADTEVFLETWMAKVAQK